MRTYRQLDVSSLVVLLLAAGATASTLVLVPTTPTSLTAADRDHAHDQHDHQHHQAGELPPLDGTTEATLERFLAIDPAVLAGAHDHDHASEHPATNASACRARSSGGVRGPGSPEG